MREFRYHACGFGVAGEFWSPLATRLSDGPSVALPSIGGHVHTRIDGVNVSGLLKTGPISCHASGTNDPQKKTLSVLLSLTVEALNVCDVVTADRIVARLLLKQADHEDQPHVVPIGSFFSNLRIAGEPVGVGLNMMLLTEHNTFDTLSRISSNLGVKSLLLGDSVVLSLVDKVQCGLPGIAVSRHGIRIPDFGDMRLAELLAAPTSRTLTMLHFSLHGRVKGELSIAEGRLGTSTLQDSSPSLSGWQSNSLPVQDFAPPHKLSAAQLTPLAEALSDLAIHPIASRHDLQSDLEAFTRLGLSTPRDFLSPLPVLLAHDSGVPLHRIVSYRDTCRSWLIQQSWDARRLLSKKGVPDKSLLALTDEMAVRLAAMLDDPNLPDRIEVVVQFQNSLTLARLLDMSPEQRTAQRQLRLREMQADPLRQSDVPLGSVFNVWLANQVIASLSQFQIISMAGNPAVRGVGPTLPIRGCMDEALKRISAKALRSSRSGSNQIVALIDSGVDSSHPDFRPGQIVHKQDFTGKGSTDQHGHGTHLAGVIGANSSAYPGVAPEAKIWSYRVLDENNTNSSHAALVKALQDAIEQAFKDKPGRMFVVNCSCEVPAKSFTSSADFQSLCDVYDSATTDAVVVVAAGNAGPGPRSITAPGSATQVLTVGASLSRPSGAPVSIPPFSSRGPGIGSKVKPDLVAPGGFHNHLGDAHRGVSVVSCSLNRGTWDHVQTRDKPWRVDTQHYGVSGTSQATALVSGICALLLEEAERRHLSVTHQEIVQALTLSAQDLFFPPNEQGRGLLDADAALSRL
jgi:subtilisin family serine protease